MSYPDDFIHKSSQAKQLSVGRMDSHRREHFPARVTPEDSRSLTLIISHAGRGDRPSERWRF